MEKFEYEHLQANGRLYGVEYRLKDKVFQDHTLISVLNQIGASGWRLVGQEGRHYIVMRQVEPEAPPELPEVGEWAFTQRHGVCKVSDISADGWWYSFEGKEDSVNRLAVRKADIPT
jgi:hypothetical protein